MEIRGSTMWRLFLLTLIAVAADDTADSDGDSSRKVLGSSVVTSVSVIMDAGNGSKIYADAVGKPVAKPSTGTDLASPINLLNPDRYEFYTFDDSGDLVKRLMTLEEIQDIIATGDGDGFSMDSPTANGFVPEKRVNDVVSNVQNVLKEEMKTHKDQAMKPQFDTPDVSGSWSMILPAIFGNSGDDIKPEPPITHVTPDTIMIEPTIVVSSTTEQISTTEKVMTLATKRKTTPKVSTTTTEKQPMINVEIITNSNSTTEKTINVLGADTKIVEIKPTSNLEMTKANPRPPPQILKPTKKPLPVKVSTFRPTRSTGAPRTTTSKATTTTSTTPSTTVARVVDDEATEASTTVFEKVVPPQLFTTEQAVPTTTLIPTEQTTATTVPPEQTTTEVPAMSTTTTTIQNEPSTEPFEISTTTEATSSTTLGTMEDTTTISYESSEKKVPEYTTPQPEVTSTFGSLSTFLIVADGKVTPDGGSTGDDLNTLSTEYVTLKTITTNKVPNSTFVDTTESQSTERTTSNLLEQFLLTSTNIYEINSELSEASQTTIPNESTTSDDSATEKNYIKLKNPTEQVVTSTTDQTFIDTIEQLISQAVGTPAPPAETEMEAMKVHEMLMNSGNKTASQVMMEAATFASNMMDVNRDTTPEPDTTTIPTTTEMDEDILLSDSVSSLLSQVYGQASTTIEDTTLTTTIIPESTTMKETSSFVPHIINITIIRNENRKNQSKPAKSDLSLEMDYEDMLKEIKKNSTLASLIPNQEILKGEASSSVLEQRYNDTDFADETTTLMMDTTTEEVTTTMNPTTTTTTTTTTPAPTSTTTKTTTISTTTASTTSSSTTSNVKPSLTIVINENKNKTAEEENTWTLVSTVAPHSDVKFDFITDPPSISTIVDPPPQIDLVPKPLQGFGLEDSTARLDSDIYQFVQLCNELAFGFWKSVTTGISSARSVVVSPFAATSLLAMVFLGARGATSGEMNEILKLDDMVTFNPHLIFKNVTESIEVNPDSGVAASTIIRELYSDRSKGKLLGFYKERVRQFYDGHVEEVSFREIGDVIRRRTNLLVKKNTNGKVAEFLKDGSIFPKPPLAGISVSIFQTDCSSASNEGRDGELHFVVLPSLRQRRLVPIPAAVYRSGFLAGYEPSLDATAASIGTKDHTISTIFIMPGQQGMSTPGDGLARLEKRLAESSFKKGAWARLLRALIPRPGLELQVPRFQHRSLLNATQSLKRMGLHDLFDSHKADLKGLNGAAHELHLSDVVQINEFATCGERRVGEAHHREVYPATTERKSRLLEWGEGPMDYLRAFHDPLHDPTYLALPLALRPRQARLPEAPRLRFDRPFLYFVRHNPSGLILHMGRFHPRLLP